MNLERERISEILKTEHFEKYTNTPIDVKIEKDASESISIKDEGNHLFLGSEHNRKTHERIWKLYTRSIATAPNDSEELGLALSNRSAFLAHMGKFKECIVDVDYALKYVRNPHMRAKLLCRKAESMAALGNLSAEDVSEEAKKELHETNMNEVLKNKFITNLDNAIYAMKSLGLQQKEDRTLDIKIPFPVKRDSACTSTALTIANNEKYGRHVIAKRKVKPGEVLAIEKPYAKCLYRSEIYTHCSHCLSSAWSSIPCDHCIFAVYCSVECKNEAWKSYHDIECPIYPYFKEKLLEISAYNQLSVRLAIIAIREAGSIGKLRKELTIVDEQCGENHKIDISDNGTYPSDQYSSVYSLSTNMDKKTPEKLNNVSERSAKYVHAMYECTSLFGEPTQIDPADIANNKDVLFVGSIISKNFHIISINVHMFQEHRNCVYHKECTCDMEQCGHIGITILPFHCLFNHSCDPNVGRYFTTDGKVILFALHPIERNAQVFDNYGFFYPTMSKEERHKHLQSFNFECGCTPCKEDWPLYCEIPSYMTLVLSEKSKELIQDALKFNRSKKPINKPLLPEQQISAVVHAIEVLFKYAPKPCFETQSMVHTLRSIYAMLYGTFLHIPRIDQCEKPK